MQTIMNKEEQEWCRKILRNHSTSAEATLWRLLKNKQIDGLKFRRQHSIGPYIVDFYCPALRLAIELDGEVHSRQLEHDEQRTYYLQKNGIEVLRFENRTVFENAELIIDEIKRKVITYHLPPSGYSPPQSPPLSGENNLPGGGESGYLYVK